jgi:sporulation protein YlmC with PRC-barrel domain/osmotically-inducible protein OsmY
MKKTLKLSLVSLCASGAVVATQVVRANHDRSASNDSDKQLVITEPAGAQASASTSAGSEMGAQVRASSLVGQKVVDSSGKRIGKVRDALIDLQTGRLAFLVIDTKGRQIAVPGDQCRSQGTELSLNIASDRLMTAPAFSYQSLNDPNWISQNSSFYGSSWEGGQAGGQVAMSSPSMQSGSSFQSGGTSVQGGSIQSGGSFQNNGFYEASGAQLGGPRMVTGHDQDCQADCILHRYQAGKGSARATDEHYFNNVSGDRLYSQYPANGAYNNYSSYSYNSQPSSSSYGSSYSSQPSSGSGSWYSVSPSGQSDTSLNGSSSVISESAGASAGMHLYRSSDLIGMHVRASNGQDLGEIRDVVLDLNSGRIGYAVLVPTSGQFGGKYLAVPPSAFTRGGNDQHVLMLSMDANQLRNAPSFEANNWPQPQNQTFISEVYNFYHVTPYWQSSGQGNWNNDTHRMHHDRNNGTDTFHGSQDLNNSQGSSTQGSYQGSTTSGTDQGSSTSGSIQGNTSTDQQNLNQSSPQGSIQNQGTSSDQNLNNQNQNNQQPVHDPSGADVKGAEHHGSASSLDNSQGAAGASATQPSSSSDQGSSSSSSSGTQSDEQLKKTVEHQNDAVKEPAGADQSSATQSGTAGAQSSSELKSSQTQQGTATQEAAGANTSTSDQSGTQSGTQSSATSTSPDQTSTSSSSTTGTSGQSTANTSSSDQSGSNQGLSEKVRNSLRTDGNLSPISAQVQVSDQNGKVALTGNVKSESEKQQIVSKAEELAGSGNVIDNLQVKSDNK